MSVYYHRYTE